MNNLITASILFCFKGKNHSPSLELDLEQIMDENRCIPNLYPLIARANNFDLYSYEYEIMQAESIYFSNPQGMVSEHVFKNSLDIATFERAWHENRMLEQLQKISSSTLSISNLAQHPELLQALKQAYNLGKDNQKL